MMPKSCEHCGAVLPGGEVHLEDIPGQEHVKRAIEVAMAGSHTLTLVAQEGSGAEDLAGWAASHGVSTRLVYICPCGNHLSPIRECTCSVRTITKYRSRKAYQLAMKADIVILVDRPSRAAIERHLSGRRGENDEVVLARVSEAALVEKKDEPVLAPECVSLVNAFLNAYNFGRLERAVAVGETIRRMSWQRTDCVHAAHLAEAMQYTASKEWL